MKKIVLSLIFTLIACSLPGNCSRGDLSELITDDKLPQKDAYAQINLREYKNHLRAKKKGGKGSKGGFGTDSVSNCPVCSNPVCPSAPQNTCPTPTSYLGSLGRRYRFNISIIQGLTDVFEINVTNVDPTSGIFKYTATNFRTGIVQDESVGIVSYDTVNFTLGTINVPDATGLSLIHALNCTGFFNNGGSISGVCATVGQSQTTGNLTQIGQPFNAIAN